MPQKQTGQPRRNWPIIVISLAVVTAIVLFFVLRDKTNLFTKKLSDGECYNDISGKDPKSYIKLTVKYSAAKIKDLNLSSFAFNGAEFANACIKLNPDRDGYIMSAYVPIGTTGDSFIWTSDVSSPTKPFVYTLEVTATSATGVPIKTFKQERTIRLVGTYDFLTDTLKIQR